MGKLFLDCFIIDWFEGTVCILNAFSPVSVSAWMRAFMFVHAHLCVCLSALGTRARCSIFEHTCAYPCVSQQSGLILCYARLSKRRPISNGPNHGACTFQAFQTTLRGRTGSLAFWRNRIVQDGFPKRTAQSYIWDKHEHFWWYACVFCLLVSVSISLWWQITCGFVWPPFEPLSEMRWRISNSAVQIYNNFTQGIIFRCPDQKTAVEVGRMKLIGPS